MHIQEEVKIGFAIILGGILQILLVPKEQLRVGLILTILISSLFVGLFFVPVVIELFEIESITIQRLLYSLSGLLSLAIITLLIELAPKVLRVKILRMLGVDDVVQSGN